MRTMAGPASGGVQRWSIMRVICAIGARCSRCDAIRRPEIVPPRNITDAHVRPLGDIRPEYRAHPCIRARHYA